MIISKEQYDKLSNHLKKYFEEFKNLHPTVKPVSLFSYLITLGSREGEIVLDPFMGSGTSGIASKLLNRKFIGIEMSKEYLEIAVARIKSYKGGE